MSEVEAQAPPPAEIVPSKSEDKLEIEKEEKQKAEDIVGEMFDSDKKKDEPEENTSDEKKGETSEEKAAESSEPVEKQSTEKAEEVEGEKKDEEKTESKEKKFNIPKIKTPKVIKEIRSRSKSREKKKNKEGTGPFL